MKSYVIFPIVLLLLSIATATSAQVESSIPPKQFRLKASSIAAPGYPDPGFSFFTRGLKFEFEQRVDVFLHTQDVPAIRVDVDTNLRHKSRTYAKDGFELVVTSEQIKRAMRRMPRERRSSTYLIAMIVEQIPFLKAIGSDRLWPFWELNRGDVPMFLMNLSPEDIAHLLSKEKYPAPYRRSKSRDVVGGYYNNGAVRYLMPHFRGELTYEGGPQDE